MKLRRGKQLFKILSKSVKHFRDPPPPSEPNFQHDCLDIKTIPTEHSEVFSFNAKLVKNVIGLVLAANKTV